MAKKKLMPEEFKERILHRRDPITLNLSLSDRVSIDIGLKKLEEDYARSATGVGGEAFKRLTKDVKDLRNRLRKVV